MFFFSHHRHILVLAIEPKRLGEERTMHFVNFYFISAICLTALVGAIIASLYWRKSFARASRLQRMMLSCGIDKDAAIRTDQVLTLDMDAVRSRCRICPATDLCERWLNGEAIVTNSFCPNAWHFFAAASAGQPSPDSGYMSRWIKEPR
jgi:hypothetical protein